MKEIFADSFYFMALLNSDDAAHMDAESLTATIAERIVTTPWVLVEVGDAFCSPATRPAFLALLASLRAQPEFLVLPAEQEILDAGIRIFADRPDKYWSLTDCISFAVMQQRQIREALTGDHHFEQAGFVALMKQ